MSEERDIIEQGRPGPARGWPALLRRGPSALVARTVAGAVAVALIAVIVLVATSSGSPEHEYTTLPDACTLVSATTLGKYLPDATGGPEQMPPGVTNCAWASISSTADRDLVVSAELYGSAAAATTGRQAVYNGFAASARSDPALSTRTMPGLGDHALAVLLPPGDGPHAVELLVWSGNAQISLVYLVNWARPAPGAPTITAELDAVTAMAGDALSALARPVPAAAPATQQPGPRYGNPADPCALLTMTTVTRYVPGALPGTKLPSQDQPVQGSGPFAPGVLSSQLPVQPGGDCFWSGNPARPETLEVAVSIYSSATGLTGAEQYFDTDRQTDERSIPGSWTITGTQSLTGLGNQATAVYASLTGPGHAGRDVALLTWSGNAEVVITYTAGATTSRTALLAAATSICRDVLTALPRTR